MNKMVRTVSRIPSLIKELEILAEDVSINLNETTGGVPIMIDGIMADAGSIAEAIDMLKYLEEVLTD